MNPRTLPPAFVEMLRGYGSVAEPLLDALAGTEPSLAVRVNNIKGIVPAIEADAVPWLPGRGFYLEQRPLFAADPAWHQGLYYVQDASSMAMTAVVDEICRRYYGDQPVRYLDACAAPGGKTIAAIEALPQGSVVLANEYDRKRSAALLENVAKHGYPSVALSCADAASLGKLGPVFDIVAVDAPCSGEGMMRKEPEAVAQWSEGLVAACANTQRDILAGVWQCLKPGGVLIYSTCTFNRVENEHNLAFIVENLGGESIPLATGAYPGVCVGLDTPYHCYRFMPGHVRGEGLFVAAVRKPDESFREPKMKPLQAKVPTAVADFAGAHLADADGMALFADTAESFSVCPVSQAPFMAYLVSKLRLLRRGLPLCTIKGRDLLPAWELAFSTALRAASFPTLDLDLGAALAYLHGDSLSDIPADLPKGIAAACYGGRPLGFIKNIGRRANNLYPEALRLRMDSAAAASAHHINLIKG